MAKIKHKSDGTFALRMTKTEAFWLYMSIDTSYNSRTLNQGSKPHAIVTEIEDMIGSAIDDYS